MYSAPAATKLTVDQATAFLWQYRFFLREFFANDEIAKKWFGAEDKANLRKLKKLYNQEEQSEFVEQGNVYFSSEEAQVVLQALSEQQTVLEKKIKAWYAPAVKLLDQFRWLKQYKPEFDLVKFLKINGQKFSPTILSFLNGIALFIRFAQTIEDGDQFKLEALKFVASQPAAGINYGLSNLSNEEECEVAKALKIVEDASGVSDIKHLQAFSTDPDYLEVKQLVREKSISEIEEEFYHLRYRCYMHAEVAKKEEMLALYQKVESTDFEEAQNGLLVNRLRMICAEQKEECKKVLLKEYKELSTANQNAMKSLTPISKWEIPTGSTHFGLSKEARILQDDELNKIDINSLQLHEKDKQPTEDCGFTRTLKFYQNVSNLENTLSPKGNIPQTSRVQNFREKCEEIFNVQSGSHNTQETGFLNKILTAFEGFKRKIKLFFNMVDSSTIDEMAHNKINATVHAVKPH